ncbi:hypothetical protein TSMEX_010904 [Taenia solium]|eukprot:TsM_000765600 transcript=TsM_000765600 gene=TsM_000765600
MPTSVAACTAVSQLGTDWSAPRLGQEYARTPIPVLYINVDIWVQTFEPRGSDGRGHCVRAGADVATTLNAGVLAIAPGDLGYVTPERMTQSELKGRRNGQL